MWTKVNTVQIAK